MQAALTLSAHVRGQDKEQVGRDGDDAWWAEVRDSTLARTEVSAVVSTEVRCLSDCAAARSIPHSARKITMATGTTNRAHKLADNAVLQR